LEIYGFFRIFSDFFGFFRILVSEADCIFAR